ncbi:MAG: hypothetical protein HY801_15405, partial [Candidatus Lindowbacteria bacterium]|nr:hypothetical protein [Candidatus Lindowbacteria bacterium]
MKGDLPGSRAQLENSHEGKLLGGPVPEIGYHVCRKRRGLVPRVLEPILEKRRIYKEIAGKREEAKGEIPLFPPLQRGSFNSPLYQRGAGGDLEKGEEGRKRLGEKAKRGKGEDIQQSRRGSADDSVGANLVFAQELSSQWANTRFAPTERQTITGRLKEDEFLKQIRDLKASCKKRQNALKWMLVTCFGYLGYKNARFGRIEAHEAVTALGREKLLQAKEIAERRGFELVHAIVDSLWVRKPDMTTTDQPDTIAGKSPLPPFIKGGKRGRSEKSQIRKRDITSGDQQANPVCHSDLAEAGEESPVHKQNTMSGNQQAIPICHSEPFGCAQDKLSEGSQSCNQGILLKDQQELLREISETVGIPIALEGNYRWIAFVPSRTAPGVAVANRYFGLFDNGEMKMRGLEVRRSDVPPIVKKMQTEMLRVLSSASTAEEFKQKTAEVLEILKSYLARLRRGEVQAEELVISQKLSKNPSEYKTNTAMAAASGALLASGIKPQPGERVGLILVDSKARGQATKSIPYTAAVEHIDAYDIEKYAELLVRAAETVLLRRLSKRELAEELL